MHQLEKSQNRNRATNGTQSTSTEHTAQNRVHPVNFASLETAANGPLWLVDGMIVSMVVDGFAGSRLVESGRQFGQRMKWAFER